MIRSLLLATPYTFVLYCRSSPTHDVAEVGLWMPDGYKAGSSAHPFKHQKRTSSPVCNKPFCSPMILAWKLLLSHATCCAHTHELSAHWCVGCRLSRRLLTMREPQGKHRER